MVMQHREDRTRLKAHINDVHVVAPDKELLRADIEPLVSGSSCSRRAKTHSTFELWYYIVGGKCPAPDLFAPFYERKLFSDFWVPEKKTLYCDEPLSRLSVTGSSLTGVSRKDADRQVIKNWLLRCFGTSRKLPPRSGRSSWQFLDRQQAISSVR
ncbi:hypothetical protein MRX96_013616 [Rhipicephalus microplus]